MPRTHYCAQCGSDSGEWQGRLKKCSACRRVTYCSRRCQRQHWAVHRSLCRREGLHLWWRSITGRGTPRLPSWAVIIMACVMAFTLALLACRAMQPTAAGWVFSSRDL